MDCLGPATSSNMAAFFFYIFHYLQYDFFFPKNTSDQWQNIQILLPVDVPMLVTIELAEMPLWGCGECCTWNDCTTSERVHLTSVRSPVSIFKTTSSWRKEAIVESEAENAHFQPRAWRFLTTKNLPRFANHGAFTVCVKKSPLGWIFEAQTASKRTTVAYGRNPSVLPWFRLMKGMTVISKNARKGKIAPKRTRIQQRWVNFIHFIEWKLNFSII